MMNVIAISLMIASMAFAGVWSPAPQEDGGGEQVIMKGGHRAVVVEYADDNAGKGNTKVSISPPLTSSSLEEQLSSAAAAVAGVSQDAKKAAVGAVGQDEAHGWGPGELICDAFGKCKHKISGAIYKAKNKVTETAHEVEEGAKETVDSAIDKAKDLSSKVTDAAERGKDEAKRSVSRAKEAAEDTAEDLVEKAGEAKRRVSRARDAVQDKTEELKHRGKATIEKAGEAAEKEISGIAKRAKEVAYDVVSFLVPKQLFKSLIRVVHLLGFATAYGTATWVTFAMSHLLARSLPRQQFGVVQSRVYPVYFKALASSVGLALLGHLFGRSRRPEVSNEAWRFQVYNLVASIALVLVNLLYLEPRATKVMYERMKIEKEEGRGVSFQATRLDEPTDHTGTPPSATTTTTAAQRREDVGEAKMKMERLNKRLRKLNSYSSLLNVMTLMGLTWHLVYLSQRLCL
ncbi:hypothetical protein V2J09_013920 [Rumex salicifolius]